ncbi:hypothetical protein [Neobacillus dielmonensis]|uniref:hypothetical protein n=1 Tax=Neobacillus dielmonensis TaxID=1347369 RepID=UPI000A4A15B4|nr:hypothetical protein [Neobacillus dielmonensis]
MENNRQGNNNREHNHDGGMMDKIGEVFENVVDTITGDNQKNGQQKQRNNNKQ